MGPASKAGQNLGRPNLRNDHLQIATARVHTWGLVAGTVGDVVFAAEMICRHAYNLTIARHFFVEVGCCASNRTRVDKEGVERKRGAANDVLILPEATMRQLPQHVGALCLRLDGCAMRDGGQSHQRG